LLLIFIGFSPFTFSIFMRVSVFFALSGPGYSLFKEGLQGKGG
jgi:hypothetical protein